MVQLIGAGRKRQRGQQSPNSVDRVPGPDVGLREPRLASACTHYLLE